MRIHHNSINQFSVQNHNNLHPHPINFQNEEMNRIKSDSTRIEQHDDKPLTLPNQLHNPNQNQNIDNNNNNSNNNNEHYDNQIIYLSQSSNILQLKQNFLKEKQDISKNDSLFVDESENKMENLVVVDSSHKIEKNDIKNEQFIAESVSTIEKDETFPLVQKNENNQDQFASKNEDSDVKKSPNSKSSFKDDMNLEDNSFYKNKNECKKTNSQEFFSMNEALDSNVILNDENASDKDNYSNSDQETNKQFGKINTENKAYNKRHRLSDSVSISKHNLALEKRNVSINEKNEKIIDETLDKKK